MARCVLRYPSVSEAPSGDIDRIALDRDVDIVDRAHRGLALIDIPIQALPRIRKLLPGWTVQPEQLGHLPERQNRHPLD